MSRQGLPPGEPEIPGIAAILGMDHTAALAFIGPLAGWLLAALISLIPTVRPVLTSSGSQGPGFLFIVIFATVVGWAIALMRVYSIRSLFNRGIPALGQVCSCRSYRTGVHVDYRYAYHGRPYQASAELLANERSRQIQVGDSVGLVVDPARPNIALIRDLYL